LDRGRKCGWQGFGDNGGTVVWAGGSAATTRCPKSELRGESVAWVEMFAAAGRFGLGDPMQLESREGEAMTILAQEAERTRDEGSGR
jgi:hypothetical protein